MSLTTVHFLLAGGVGAFWLTVPVSLPEADETDVWDLTWNTSAESAESLVNRLEKSLGGQGLRLHFGNLESSDETAIPMVTTPDFLIMREAVGPTTFLTWSQFLGSMYMQLANFRPDVALQIELAPYRDAQAVATTGLFLLQSPNTVIWHILPRAIQDVWSYFRQFRLHVLVHGLEDFAPQLWRRALGSALGALGGLHWCGSVNRAPKFNRRLAESRNTDNYFNKVFMMLAIAEHQHFQWILSVDDDVFLPPASLMSLLRSGPMADERGCGLLLPLTQNGIPSTETFARSWLSEMDRAELFRCFSQSSGQFCTDGSLMQNCWNATDDSIPAVPVPDPWDEAGNIMVDSEFQYPYFANNVFLMRFDRYVRVMAHPDCCQGTDERAMNQVLQEERVPLCMDPQTFGLHPAWGNFGQTMKNAVELQTSELMKDLFPAQSTVAPCCLWLVFRLARDRRVSANAVRHRWAWHASGAPCGPDN